MDAQESLARILARDHLSLEDVKAVMRVARRSDGDDEKIAYANTLISGAADHLRPYSLRALVRADITVEEAASQIEQDKKFVSRLVNLLPSLVRFFGEEARSRNLKGIISMIDDCHNDFHFTARSSRRDRQLREAKEKLTNASKLAGELATALEDSKEHCDIQFERFHAVYYPAANLETSRFLGDLIDELRMCSGVLEIMNATADRNPKRLFVFGNDTRTTVVEWAYHMCTFWDGPKLVTTPSSDFATLCSLLFEAVTGEAEESLAGAINRYARSDDREEWDRDGEDEDERDKDNFLSQNNIMAASTREVNLCKRLLQDVKFTDMARLLLLLRIEAEQRTYDEARTKYGPHQVYIHQMNQEQWDNMLHEAYKRFKPDQRIEFVEEMSLGKTMAIRDVELGKKRRAEPNHKLDV